MWKWDEETGWFYEGYTDLYFYQNRLYEYPVSLHEEKLNLSITEAAIATKQRVERDEFYERDFITDDGRKHTHTQGQDGSINYRDAGTNP